MSSRTSVTFRLPAGILKTNQLRIGYVASSRTIIVGDLAHNEIVDNFSQLKSQHILILMASAGSSSSQTDRILQNICDALFSNNHPFLSRPDPKKLKLLFQNHLQLERSFFEEPSIGLTEESYSGFLLTQNRVYPLHTGKSLELCYIHRKGQLLEFNLSAYQFIRLEPEDLFILAQPQDMQLLLKSNTFRFFNRAFQQAVFADPTEKQGFKKLRKAMKGSLIGIKIKGDEKVVKQKTIKTIPSFSLTKTQKLIAVFILMWLITILSLPWL